MGWRSVGGWNYQSFGRFVYWAAGVRVDKE